MSNFWLYLILQLDTIVGFAALMSVLTGMAAIVLGFMYISTYNLCKEEKDKVLNILNRIRYIIIPICIFCTFIAVFIPSTKQIFTIKAYHILKDKNVSATADKVFESVDKYLDEYLERN